MEVEWGYSGCFGERVADRGCLVLCLEVLGRGWREMDFSSRRSRWVDVWFDSMVL